MKKTILAAVLAVSAAGLARADISADELVTLALKDSVAEAQSSIAAAEKIPAGKPVAILPLAGDGSGLAAGLLKNALTDAGRTCVEGKEDPMWDEILKEIEWDERKDDILDPATLDKFGKLKSAQYLLYGAVRRLAATERHVLVELELHVSCIATKEHVWGGSFVRRHYAPGADPKGSVDIPSEVRTALVDGIRAKISESLAKSARIGAVKRVAILPVAGDVDQYAAGLLRDVLSSSSVAPVNLDVTTRAEARFALREGPGKADAIAYGALRDLESRLVETKADGEKIYSAHMELQLWIENGATREILWSDTVQFSKEFSSGPRGMWDKLCHLFPYLSEHPSAVVWIPALAIFVLIALFMFLKAATRVR
jgi:hypothetical protein